MIAKVDVEWAVSFLLEGHATNLGLTQDDIALRLGVTRPYVTQVLGGRNITVLTLARFAEAMGSKLIITLEEKR